MIQSRFPCRPVAQPVDAVEARARLDEEDVNRLVIGVRVLNGIGPGGVAHDEVAELAAEGVRDEAGSL
jgi:hypothetical protein